jgi:O-antigen/teichoic acid export membrane protein
MTDYGLNMSSILNHTKTAKYKNKNKINLVANDLIYCTNFIFIIAILNILGFIYVYIVFREYKYLYAYEIFIFGIALSSFSKKYLSYLNSIGKMHEYYKFGIYANIVMLIICVISMTYGFGIYALGVGLVAYGLVVSIKAKKYSQPIRLMSINRDHWRIILKKFFKIFSDILKYGLASIGAFLILRGNIFVGSIYLNNVDVAEYSFSIFTLFYISIFARLPFGVVYSKICSEIENNNIKLVKKYLNRVFLFSILIYLFLVIIFYILISYNNKYQYLNISILSGLPLFLIIIMYFLELIHSISCGYINAKDDLNFYKSSLITGILCVLLCLIGMKWFNAGLLWAILSQLFAQLLYNNWFWPYNMIKDLKGKSS